MQTVKSYSQLLAEFKPEGEGFGVSVSDNWRQGRTVYGGLSAALCVEAATRSVASLPPLRSAILSFIAPAEGDLLCVPSLLRRGKTTVFVAVDLFSKDQLAVRALLCFAAARPSALNYSNLPLPVVAAPDRSAPLRAYESAYPFTRNFDWRLASGEGPFSGSKVPQLTHWLRHTDRGAADSASGLIVLADVPPAAIALWSAQAPVSTLTWIIDVLTDFPVGDDGWRLAQVRADTIQGGYSSEQLNLWSSSGPPLLASRQCVAVFA